MAISFQKILLFTTALLTISQNIALADPPRTSATTYFRCGDFAFSCGPSTCDMVPGQSGTNGALILSHGSESRASFLRRVIPLLYIHAHNDWYHCRPDMTECFREGTRQTLILTPSVDAATVTPAALLRSADQVSYEGREFRCRRAVRNNPCNAPVNQYINASVSAPNRRTRLPTNYCTYLAPDSPLHSIIPRTGGGLLRDSRKPDDSEGESATDTSQGEGA